MQKDKISAPADQSASGRKSTAADIMRKLAQARDHGEEILLLMELAVLEEPADSFAGERG